MSLSKSITEIADDMQLASEAIPDVSYQLLFVSYVKQLRKAIKEDLDNTKARNAVFPDHRTMIEKAKQDLRKERIKSMQGELHQPNDTSSIALLQEDKADGIATFLVGGTEDGDMLIRNPEMPMNAHIEHLGNVYTLAEDGRLHFNEDQTRRLQSTRVKG